MNEHGRNDRDILRYTDVEYTPEGYENVYRWDDFLEIAGGDARYAAMLINRTVAGEPEEGLHPETLVDQDIRDGEAFMLAGRPIVPEDVCDLLRTVHGLYSELVDNVGRSGTLLRDWRGFSAGADADDVLREIEGAFGETEDSRAGTVLGAYVDDTFMSPIYAAEDAARDVTPLTPWEDEGGVAFLSRTLDADASAVVPCLWYCRRDEGQGFEVGGVKLDCSKIAFDEVAAAAASNGFDCVLAYLEESISGSEPLCDIAVRRIDAGRSDAVRRFGSQDEAMAMLGAIVGCRIQAYGVDTMTYRMSLDSAAAAKLAAAKHDDYRCPVPLASMIAIGMQRAHVCYADGSFTGQMQRFLSPAVLDRTHDFDNHCNALNAIVEKCYGRVAASLGISDQVEHARCRLATEISSGSISATGMPKRNLVLS